MTPPGIGSTRAEVTGMVPSTVLECWCPYTPMCSGVSSARSRRGVWGGEVRPPVR